MIAADTGIFAIQAACRPLTRCYDISFGHAIKMVAQLAPLIIDEGLARFIFFDTFADIISACARAFRC